VLDVIRGAFYEDELVFDVYISPILNVHLMDVAPWSSTASTGMFSEAEIKEMDQCTTRFCRRMMIQPVDDPAVLFELQGDANWEDVWNSMKESE
jgi:hypothetical protein